MKPSRALKLLRIYHGLTQHDMASRIGLKPTMVSELESGKKNATLETLEMYGKEFDMDVSAIIFFAEALENPYTESKRVAERVDVRIKLFLAVSEVMEEYEANYSKRTNEQKVFDDG